MFRYFVVVGGSMKPSFGLVTFCKCVKASFLVEGDIVVYRRKNKFVKLCHRIVKIGVCSYFIKGDNAVEVDEVGFKDIFYKVVSFRRIF